MSARVLSVVGSLVLDIVRDGEDATVREVGLGGVCLNAASAARQEFRRVQLITTRYRGNIHEIARIYLAAKGIDWRPLPATASVPLFEATFGGGDCAQQSFETGRAFELLDAGSIVADAVPDEVLLTCTSLSVSQLDTLLGGFATSFLLASSPATAPILAHLAAGPDFLGVNQLELERTAGRPLPTLGDLAEAVVSLVKPTGYAVVTVGAEGALLVCRASHRYFHQPILKGLPERTHWLGAGDELFGTFAGAVCHGMEPTFALARGIVAAGAPRDRTDHATLADLIRASSGWMPMA